MLVDAHAATLPSTRSISEAPASFSGKRIDHFDIGRLLGRGGMGAVYAAKDISLDRHVAIKFLLDELASDPILVERFIREARAQARLHSPHVVNIHFIGRLQPKGLYFAMELVDGESLDDVIERKEQIDRERARQWMMCVALGLRDAN